MEVLVYDIFPATQDYLRPLATSLYATVGFTAAADEPAINKFLRSQAFALVCSLDYEACETDVVKNFGDWIDQPDAGSDNNP